MNKIIKHISETIFSIGLNYFKKFSILTTNECFKSRNPSLEVYFSLKRNYVALYKSFQNLYRATGKVVQITYLISQKERKNFRKWKYQHEFSPGERKPEESGEDVAHFVGIDVSKYPYTCLSCCWLHLHHPTNLMGWFIKIIHAKEKFQNDLPLLPSLATKTPLKGQWSALVLSKFNYLFFWLDMMTANCTLPSSSRLIFMPAM